MSEKKNVPMVGVIHAAKVIVRRDVKEGEILSLDDIEPPSSTPPPSTDRKEQTK